MNEWSVVSSPEFRDRFWSKVKVGRPLQCWPWRGNRDNKGYGRLRVQRRYLKAHRLAWALFNERWPELHVLHSCDNPWCCNPLHLREGTDADNMRDRDSRGRHGNSRKTQCPQGHPYDAKNTHWYLGKYRKCRICVMAYNKAAYAARAKAKAS